MKKVLTLAYLLKENEICLAMKKRGFGEGNWNGYGGKLEEHESIEDAAVREIREESGVEAEKGDLKKVSIINFYFKDGLHMVVHGFFIYDWKGTPIETEEMKPAWFSQNAIPFEKMWADDIHWIPRALVGQKLYGEVWFQDDGKSIEKMEWKEVMDFDEKERELKSEF